MKMTKKVLGVVIALAMLANVFAMFSFAAAPDSAVDLTMSVDKESYNAGDLVTITVSEKVIPEVGEMRLGGAYAIGYDSTKIEMPVTGVYDELPTNIGFNPIQGGYDNGGSNITWTDGVVSLGDTIDSEYGWNSVTVLSVCDDQGKTCFDATSGIDLFTFQMKIAEDCPDGDFVIGFNKGSYQNYTAFCNDKVNQGIVGWDDDYGYGTTANYTLGTVTIHVGEAAEASIITPMSSQIRFQGIGADGDKTNYANKFDVRTRAKIANDDFVAKFGADGEKLADIGFIYASTTEVEDFSMATAQAVAQGTDATGYVKYSCKYVQHTGDGADYIFTCLIADIDDTEANKQDGVNCVAFAKDTDGNYYFYSDVTTVSYGSLYTAYMPA